MAQQHQTQPEISGMAVPPPNAPQMSHTTTRPQQQQQQQQQRCMTEAVDPALLDYDPYKWLESVLPMVADDEPVPDWYHPSIVLYYNFYKKFNPSDGNTIPARNPLYP
eukprot:GHVQ01003330.1.p1 GENE.GHVQ01003330.1~~GHVQ01003330.1.p1  ORF type:complete len:108 (-),score=27.27 GHVQ01003330.1:185-508(-)